MEYITKGFRFDEEVMAWLDKLKAMHGSYNKGLRLIAFTEERRGKPAIDVEAHQIAAKAIEAAQPKAVKAARKQTKAAMAIQARASSDVVAQAAGRDDIDYSDVESTPTTHVATLDAVSPTGPVGKISMENWRANRKPLLKPKDRK